MEVLQWHKIFIQADPKQQGLCHWGPFFFFFFLDGASNLFGGDPANNIGAYGGGEPSNPSLDERDN